MPVAVSEIEKTRTTLDAWVRELMLWHFSPDTGCPFWLQWAEKAGWDPRKEIETYQDLDKFGLFQDEWLRGGPVRRWVPKAYKDKPIYTFETGGSTGVPKSRVTQTTSASTTRISATRCPANRSRKAPTGSWSGRAARAGCGSQSSTSRSIAAASASWSISIRAGSSS